MPAAAGHLRHILEMARVVSMSNSERMYPEDDVT